MSVSLSPDGIMAVCKRRWQGHVLCWLAQIVAAGWFLDQRSAQPHGPARPALLAATGLALAFLALGDWLWRCPACKARLPRGMVTLPRYCPLCAVPLSDPAAPRLVGSRPAKQVAYGCIGFLVLLSVTLQAAPPGRHSLVGPGAKRRVIITQLTPAEVDRLQR